MSRREKRSSLAAARERHLRRPGLLGELTWCWVCWSPPAGVELPPPLQYKDTSFRLPTGARVPQPLLYRLSTVDLEEMISD